MLDLDENYKIKSMENMLTVSEFRREMALLTQKNNNQERIIGDLTRKEKKHILEIKNLKKEHYAEIKNLTLKYETMNKTLELNVKELNDKIQDLEVLSNYFIF